MPTSDALSPTWLLGEQAETALREMASIDDPLAASKRLRKKFTAEQARLVVEQLELRKRARQKFARHDAMFFTRQSLEQATDEQVAACKAGYFAECPRVADLCCGIGGDALGLAQVAEVVGYDLDETLLQFANANAQVNEASAEFRCDDVTRVDLSQFDAWHLDPDRRADGRRSVQLANHCPDLAAIEQMLRINPNAAIKLAPATVVPEHWRSEFEFEWISRGRECKQLVAWHGSLVGLPGRHRATAIGTRGLMAGIVSEPTAMPAAADFPRAYLHEPDPAVIAADLTGALADLNDLSPLGTGAVYLTSEHPVDHPLLTSFEVLAADSWSLKRFRGILSELNMGPVEVKKRGVSVDPAKLASQLKSRGDQPGVLIVTRIGKRQIGIVARRLQETA